MAVALSVLIFVLFVAAIIDAITIDRSRVRFLDKFFWIVIVILIPAIGSVLWFIFGREYIRAPIATTSPRQWTAPTVRPSVPTSVSDTERQLAEVEREIAADRVRELEARVQEKRDHTGRPGRAEHNSCSNTPETGSTPSPRDDTGTPA